MHPYSLDSEARRRAMVVLGVAAVAIAYVLGALLQAAEVSAPWWADMPGPIGIWGLLFLAMDRWIWRTAAWRAAFGVPVIDGDWDVEVRSSHERHAVPTVGTATIRQTWSHIVIEFEMRESTSKSIAASLTVSGGAVPELVYSYRNDPRPGARETMVPSFGMARLRVDSAMKLSGDYFTGRGRSTHGSITLTRKNPDNIRAEDYPDGRRTLSVSTHSDGAGGGNFDGPALRKKTRAAVHALVGARHLV